MSDPTRHMTPWRYTNDPSDPCSLCVQWREVTFGEHEPYWPDGSVPPRIFDGVHGRCEASVVAMQEEHRANG